MRFLDLCLLSNPDLWQFVNQFHSLIYFCVYMKTPVFQDMLNLAVHPNLFLNLSQCCHPSIVSEFQERTTPPYTLLPVLIYTGSLRPTSCSFSFMCPTLPPVFNYLTSSTLFSTWRSARLGAATSPPWRPSPNCSSIPAQAIHLYLLKPLSNIK